MRQLVDDEELRRLALNAGLDRMLAEFPEDVREAAETVAKQRAQLPKEPEQGEPWPPMWVPGR
jgi:hypothetical protein